MCIKVLVLPTSPIIHIFGIASFKCTVPVAGVVSPPARCLSILPLLHPGGAIPATRPACLLKHSAHDAEPSSVWRWRPWGYHGVPTSSASWAAVPDKARVQEDEAPGRQVKEDEGEETDGFPAEITLYLQQRLGHAGSPCHSDTLSVGWKLIKQKNQHRTAHLDPKKSDKVSQLSVEVIQTKAWLFPHVCLLSLLRKMPHNCPLCISADLVSVSLSSFPLTVQPRELAPGLWHETWVAQSERWSLNTAFIPVISLQRCHTSTAVALFSHAV